MNRQKVEAKNELRFILFIVAETIGGNFNAS